MEDGSAKLSGRDHEFREPTLVREVGSGDLSGELQGEPEGPQPAESRGDEEAQQDFWSIQGDFTHRHQIELTVQFFVPREESFPTSLKYIDVIKSPHTDLDVAQEKRIYDYWDVDKNRNLSDSWTAFTRFTLLDETPSRGFPRPGGRLTKIQTASRLDHIRPGAWIRIGKAAQRREKQEWAIEKPKLEHARNLRGIYSIDPSDEEYEDISKNARRKLETPKAAAMPCKRAFSQASIRETGFSKTRKAKTSEAKTRFSCIAEAHESTRQRTESVTKRIHEEHIAGKGQKSVLHYNLVHKFIPMPQVMKIPDAKAAVDKEWKKRETIPAWDVRRRS